MADLEQLAPEPDSAAAGAADTEQIAGDALDQDLDLDNPELQQQSTEDAEEEDEIDGVKLRGKRELLDKIKAERMKDADYRQKTQSVAEERKSVEADKARFQEAAQVHQQYLREYAQVVSIDDRLAEFAKVNWSAWSDADPLAAQKAHFEYTQLQSRKGELVQNLTLKQQQQALGRQQETAKQTQQARAVLERDIKGWSPELANKLVEYGQSQGYAPEVLNNVTKPEFVKTLHKAYLYDQLQKQRAAKPTPKPAEPVTRVGGGSAVTTKEPARMSDAEFAAWRKRQIAQRR